MLKIQGSYQDIASAMPQIRSVNCAFQALRFEIGIVTSRVGIPHLSP